MAAPMPGSFGPSADAGNAANQAAERASLARRRQWGVIMDLSWNGTVARSIKNHPCNRNTSSRVFWLMKVEFYGHVRQYRNLQKEIDANIQQVLLSGQYVMGPMLKQFEEELARYHGMKYAVGVGNGTDAIWLTLMALGIGPGHEVITHPNTFFATAEAIWIAGATAVFVDCDPKSKCIDPAKIEAAITPMTRAIVPVHLYGQCADMVALRRSEERRVGKEYRSRWSPYH